MPGRSLLTPVLALGLVSSALSEEPITGEALERASAAALEFTGGGRVTGTEVGDEEGYYEVEVTLSDGSQVDVHLDASFNVINTEGDGHAEDEDEDEIEEDDDTNDDGGADDDE
jgi:hypothetical protein